MNGNWCNNEVKILIQWTQEHDIEKKAYNIKTAINKQQKKNGAEQVLEWHAQLSYSIKLLGQTNILSKLKKVW